MRVTCQASVLAGEHTWKVSRDRNLHFLYIFIIHENEGIGVLQSVFHGVHALGPRGRAFWGSWASLGPRIFDPSFTSSFLRGTYGPRWDFWKKQREKCGFRFSMVLAAKCGKIYTAIRQRVGFWTPHVGWIRLVLFFFTKLLNMY